MRSAITKMRLQHARRCGAYSLVELIIVITVLGIIASIGVVGYTATVNGSQAIVAANLEETLNTAVHRFNETNYEIIYAGGASSSAAELAVLRTLQYRNPVYPQPGSPYIRQDYSPVSSSSTSDYRLVRSGTLFTLLAPGTVGNGLMVSPSGADLGQAKYTYPTNYVTVGYP